MACVGDDNGWEREQLVVGGKELLRAVSCRRMRWTFISHPNNLPSKHNQDTSDISSASSYIVADGKRWERERIAVLKAQSDSGTGLPTAPQDISFPSE